MKKTLLIFIALLYVCLANFRCNEKNKKQPILLAQRKAPLGWVYLRIYYDSSFEFILTGLRDETTYSGIVRKSKDTLFFKYSKDIPTAGKTAIILGNSVDYIDGEYPESVEITLNKIE